MKQRLIRLLACTATLSAVTACGPTMGPASSAGGAGPDGWRWPWEGSAPYRNLGTTHYGGQQLLEVEGEFADIAVSPSGKQVVFSGRESPDDYRLFLADIDGRIRELAKTAPGPQNLSWSLDEKTLMFLTQETAPMGQRPGSPPALPHGKTIHLLTLADGSLRPVLDLPGLGAFLPSPNHRYAAVFGFPVDGGSKLDFKLDIVDISTGERTTVPGQEGEASAIHPIRWIANGETLVGSIFSEPPRQHEARIVTLTPPDGSVRHLMDQLSEAQTLSWSLDGTTMRTYVLKDGIELVVTEQSEEAEPVAIATIPLEAAPEGHAFRYETVLRSPDGQRLFTVRGTQRTTPDYEVLPERVNVLIDVNAKSARHVAPGLTPLAWLDNSRLLCHSGQDQTKRLHVVSFD